MDLTMPWGTTKSFEIAVTDQENKPVTLIDQALVCMAKENFSDADTDAVFALEVGSGITVPGENGDHTAVIKISPANTSALSRSAKTTLHYQVLLNEEGDRFELQCGKLVVTPSVAE